MKAHRLFWTFVAQLTLIFLIGVWLVWRPDGAPATVHLGLGVGTFFGFYALLVLTLGTWARFLSRRLGDGALHRNIKRFNRIVGFARWAVLVWFAIGIYLLGWGDLMERIFGAPKDGMPVSWMGLYTPAILLGIMPGLLTWMALWWAQYPADRALREQNLLNQLQADLPLNAPPRFWHYFVTNLRMQVLFIGVPLLTIVLLRDVTVRCWFGPNRVPDDWVEGLIDLACVVVVFLFAPPMLARILSTETLPPSSLRRRLEALCARSEVRCRDILLWRTHSNICNAGVMGLISPVRYVLLSDGLLETMSDEQIEAVFAHEVGHIVHRHIVWYLIFFIFCFAGASCVARNMTAGVKHSDEWMAVAYAGIFYLAFGFLSRQCERQADVFAARTVERLHRNHFGDSSELVLSPADLVAPLSPAIAGASVNMTLEIEGEPMIETPILPVGRHGVAVFSSALHRVAVVNNIPLVKHEWLHGSIQSRLNFLRHIAARPQNTQWFDRRMQRLYGLLLLALFASLLWIAMSQLTGK